MTTTGAGAGADESAWASITYPLSTQELERLGSWRLNVGAIEFLEDRTKGAVDFAFAGHLAFARYLVLHGRISA